MTRFQNKVVLITGASAGIGEATALHFAKEGASLVLAGRDKTNLFKVFEKCKSLQINIPSPLVFACDVTAENFAHDIIAATIKHFGKLDILVNNAAVVLAYESLENLNFDTYNTVMNTNLTSILKLTKAALPHLAVTKGNIVNVSSFSGHRCEQNLIAYSISKAGLDQFTKCLALEVASKGIRVNSINPGVIINTKIQLRAGLKTDDYDKAMEHNNRLHPMGRVGTVEECASVIAFLASDDASFMTGALLPVDGGRHAMHPR